MWGQITTKLPLRAIPITAGITLVLTVWAALAFWAAGSGRQGSWDDACYAARPLWAIGQAVVAFVGVAAGIRGLFAFLSLTPGRSVSKPLVVAFVALLIWTLVVFVPDGADVVLCPGQPPESL
jgi:hypothetical protein